MTRHEAARLVAVLLAAFPNARVTQTTIRQTSAVYERMLGDLDYATANAVVERLIATRKFLPTVAEIRDEAATMRDGAVKPGGAAWGLVLAAIGRHGRNKRPGVDFDLGDHVALEAVRAMNWRELCDSENPTADRARFTELYDKLAAQSRQRRIADGIAGARRGPALPPAPEPKQLASGERRGVVTSMKDLVASHALVTGPASRGIAKG